MLLKNNRKKIFTNFVLYNSSCQNACFFCTKIPKPRGDLEKNIKLEKEKLINLVQSFEIEKVDISGNDPGEVENLPELVKEIKEITHSQSIQLSTHGMTLSNIKFLIDLIKNGVDNFQLPIYGPSDKIHDRLTQNKGSFLLLFKALLNIGLIRKKYPERIKKVVLITMIMKENQSSLGKLIDFVLKLGFIDELILGLAGFFPGKDFFLPHIPNFEKLSRQLGNFIRKREKQIFQQNLTLRLLDIPPCISQINWLTTYFKPPFRGYSYFGKKDQEAPIYMLKEKNKACQQCFYNKECPGFFKTYLDEKLIKLKPLRKSL